MSTVTKKEALSFLAGDVSGQKKVRVAGVDPNSTVGELIKGLIPKMDLSGEDAEGRPITFHARLEREGRILNSSEIASDVLEPDDLIVLQPHIMAG